MHDDLIERRLGTVLRDEAGRLPFTITAAELERRLALRGRRSGNTRLTLLLAAAVAIGGIGAGAILLGLSNRPAPSPVANASPTPASSGRAEPTGPRLLPTLDDLMAVDPARILVAQAFGPPEGPGDPISDAVDLAIPVVTWGDLQGGGDYQISVACLGSLLLEVGLKAVGSDESIEGPKFACDGTVREATVHVDGPITAFASYQERTSWRVVVRGDRRQLPLPTTNPVLPPTFEGADELIRLDDATVDATGNPWGSSGLRLRPVGEVAPRVVYGADLWCEPGATVRLLFADEIAGVLTPSVETALACDGLIHRLGLPLPLPNGSPVFVAAAPGTRWSVLISSATPPVSLADDVPDWQVAGGIGPSLQFENTEMSFSDSVGDQGGPLMVVIECAGATRDIAVNVDVEGILGDAFQTFTATCAPEGRRTSFTFDTGPNGYLVRHEAPAGSWTALSLLIPDPQAR
jgi:hypothetical protein